MSGHGSHMHGSNDHELEHAAQRADKGRATAQGLEAQSLGFDYRAEAQMHLYHRWAQAAMDFQISIAVAAIGLLAKRNWVRLGDIVIVGR